MKKPLNAAIFRHEQFLIRDSELWLTADIIQIAKHIFLQRIRVQSQHGLALIIGQIDPGRLPDVSTSRAPT